jgi:hypothetical protein
MKILASLWSVVAIATLALAQEKPTAPKVSIEGADKPIGIGDIVVLSVKLDSQPKDLSTVSYSWTILPAKNIETWPDGTKVLFGTGVKPQKITVILNAAFVFTAKQGDKTDVSLKTTTTVIEVTIDDSVTPTPGPTPGPGPKPVIPSLTTAAKEWVTLVKKTPKYTDSEVKIDAEKLAESFSSIAAAIAAGTLKDQNAILKATKESNDSAISNREEWLPWFKKLSDHLSAANKDGTIKSTSQYATAWREISTGLTNASK